MKNTNPFQWAGAGLLAAGLTALGLAVPADADRVAWLDAPEAATVFGGDEPGPGPEPAPEPDVVIRGAACGTLDHCEEGPHHEDTECPDRGPVGCELGYHDDSTPMTGCGDKGSGPSWMNCTMSGFGPCRTRTTCRWNADIGACEVSSTGTNEGPETCNAGS